VPNPTVAGALERFLAERRIDLVADAAVSAIDHTNKRVVTSSGSLDYDLFIGVPVHEAPAVVRASKLGNGGFVKVDPVTLLTSVPGVYAIGDVSTVPAGDKAVPKAGAFAEDAARTVVSDILLAEGRADRRVKFEAKGTCFFELGGGQIAKINANFFGGDKPFMDVEGPLSGIADDKAAFETTRRDRWFKTGAAGAPDGEPR
jgi:sulfide:quinone oxidoreductase